MAVLRAGSPCVLLTPTATTQTTHQKPRQVTTMPPGAQIQQQPQPSMPTIQVTPQPPQPRPVTLQNRQISQGQPMQQQQQAALYGTHPRGQVPTQIPIQTGSSPVSHSAISPHPHSSSGRMPIVPLNQNSQQSAIQSYAGGATVSTSQIPGAGAVMSPTMQSTAALHHNQFAPPSVQPHQQLSPYSTPVVQVWSWANFYWFVSTLEGNSSSR